ncbi:Bro-N domain-containing protein [Streptomyces sp. NPDC088254]|uniref:BRO-N domain-containing protein n=1 Tax=Streptomyces sp. NPDC088254 TaxID=3365847 RepID=UPI00382A7C3B
MYEHNDTPPHEPTARQDAIDINDFVFAATGARVRRLTTPEGEHWFPATDVARNLGYANTRDAVNSVVSQQHATTLGDIARSVGHSDASRNIAGHGLRKTMKLVNLKGLVQLVNGCTKPEAQPFKDWVCEVIETIQRDGFYALQPAPVQPADAKVTAYVMPDQVADAIVRLEERNIRADEMMLAFQEERNDLLRQISRSQDTMADALRDIAQSLRQPPDRSRTTSAPALTPQQLLTKWRADNLVVTEDVHKVAAFLAPALLHGGAAYRVEEIAARTGLSPSRVRDCLDLLFEQGCVRRAGRGPDGTPYCALP